MGDCLQIYFSFSNLSSTQHMFFTNPSDGMESMHGDDPAGGWWLLTYLCGGCTVQITFQEPDEYLVQVRGTTRQVPSVGVVVTSLTFVTNRKTYGPYGPATGGSGFETIRHGKVTGFFGRATSTCVLSIGVLAAKVEDLAEAETVIVQEAWGGQGGVSFYEGSGDVVEVVVSYNDRHVVSLQTTYKRGGKTFTTNQHGGENGRGPKEAKVRGCFVRGCFVRGVGAAGLGWQESRRRACACA